MRKSVVATAALAILGGLLMTSSAQARPQYRDAATAAFPELVKKHGMKGKITCVLCHPSSEKSKKMRNNFGVAFGKSLASKEIGGKPKNEKDKEKLKKALAAAGKMKSHVDGKTFGDIIGAVELPGKNEAANKK